MAFGVLLMTHEDQPYQERFPAGSTVRVVSRAALKQFVRKWQGHHPLEADRVRFAGSIAIVKQVGFYHGDALYLLEGIPGVWHEGCLESAEGSAEHFSRLGVNVRSVAVMMIGVGLMNVVPSLFALKNGTTVSFGGTSDISPWFTLVFGSVFLGFGIAGAYKIYSDQRQASL